MRRLEAGDDLCFLQGTEPRVSKSILVCSRHGNAGTDAHCTQSRGKQFLDGNASPEFPVRALVRDAETAFAQYAPDSKLAVLQGTADR